MKEENALVLDYLPEGRYTDYKRNPIVQGLGTSRFTLLELIPKAGTSFVNLEQVFVGKGDREKITLVKRVLKPSELTNEAKANLEPAVEKIVDSDISRFLNFYNKAGSLSVRLHQLELLPSIGKKHVQSIVKEREKKPFESFKEISERISLLPNPKRIIIQRIISEINGEEKYYLFARPMTPQKRV
ncbi:MAG: DUF655 domain-containing protein [Candidatus Diapherotrites archaeon]|nr:DUF655 domain-containing protein [Candidatus Diapherotrites archaeon]